MSHTGIIDEAERERRFVNRLNEIVRHCRIGRVIRKTPKPYIPLPIRTPSWSWIENPINPLPTPMFMDKCGCRVGSACGNVACPHRMVATCGPTIEPIFYHPV